MFVQDQAVAFIGGGTAVPALYGEAHFYQMKDGVLVSVKLTGLPEDTSSGFFALHIHEGAGCGGEEFSQTGGHYNPDEVEHPRHAGDLPPLLSCGGNAYLAVKTDRFSVGEILGKTVVIHSGPDDFRTQPAGNAGEKIACGVIRKVRPL